MPGNPSTPPYDYYQNNSYNHPSNNRKSSPLANPHNNHTDNNDNNHHRFTFRNSDPILHGRAQQIEHDIKKLQSDLHHRTEGLARELQTGDRNAIRTMRKLLISTFHLLNLFSTKE